VKRILLSILIALTVGGFALAGEPIVIGERITRASAVMGEERTILVSTPPDYQSSRDAYPVLYMTDGAAHLTHVRGTVDFLSNSGLVPQMIIVGVTNTDRTRDLTPTRAAVTDQSGQVRQFPTSGGADRFLDFFQRELFGFIESNYRTLPYRVFSGHSFGGLFALDAFFTRPDMFDAVIAVGPSLGWDDDWPLRQARTFFEGRKRCPKILFVAMGNEERGEEKPTRLDRLEAVLAGSDAKGFEWRVVRMPDETHNSEALRAYDEGLRRVFEAWRFPHDPETGRFSGTLADLKEHFATLSKRIGTEVAPREQAVNQIGYEMLQRGDVSEALAVFRYNVRLYPDSANVHDSLGEALERAGRLSEACESYSKAVETAQATMDDRITIFRANRDRVRDQLARAKPE